jgi:hypothetical protein
MDDECDTDCDCTHCQRTRPCECERPECDVIGGTCDWMIEKYEREKS